MSINTIIDNAKILKQLATAINSNLPTTGITELTNTDTNCAVSVAGNVGTVNLNPSGITLSNLNITGELRLNDSAGVNNYVLTSKGSAMAPQWLPSSGGGSGITTLTNTDGNCGVSASGSVGTVNLNSSITVPIITATTNLNLGHTLTTGGGYGNSGDVLVSQGSSAPKWIAQSASGGITGLNNTDNNCSVSVAGNTGTVNLANSISVPTIAASTNLILPNTITTNTGVGAVGQVLISGGGGGAVSWATPAASGILSITNNDGNIAPSIFGTVANLDLSSAITVPTITATGNLNLGHTLTTSGGYGNSGDVLVSQGYSAPKWLPQSAGGGITTLNNTDGNCALAVVGSVGTVNLENNISVASVATTDFLVNNTSTLKGPILLGAAADSGTAGQLLTSAGAGLPAVWATSSGGGGITTLTNTDGNCQVSVAGSTGQINLNSSLNLTGLSVSSLTPSYTLCSVAFQLGTSCALTTNNDTGAVGQILVSNGAGNCPLWKTPNGPGLYSIANTDNNLNISYNANYSTATIDFKPNIYIANLALANKMSANGLIGDAGQVLTSGGAAGPAIWATPSGISVIASVVAQQPVYSNMVSLNCTQQIAVSGMNTLLPASITITATFESSLQSGDFNFQAIRNGTVFKQWNANMYVGGNTISITLIDSTPVASGYYQLNLNGAGPFLNTNIQDYYSVVITQ